MFTDVLKKIVNARATSVISFSFISFGGWEITDFLSVFFRVFQKTLRFQEVVFKQWLGFKLLFKRAP